MARSAGMKQEAREPSAWLELVAEGDFDTKWARRSSSSGRGKRRSEEVNKRGVAAVRSNTRSSQSDILWTNDSGRLA